MNTYLDDYKNRIKTGHKVDIKSAFVVLYKMFLGHIPRFIKAMTRRKLKSLLHVQKNLFLTLTNPGNTDLWSSKIFKLVLCTSLLSLFLLTFKLIRLAFHFFIYDALTSICAIRLSELYCANTPHIPNNLRLLIALQNLCWLLLC